LQRFRGDRLSWIHFIILILREDASKRKVHTAQSARSCTVSMRRGKQRATPHLPAAGSERALVAMVT
jgi:hypothetical protein